MCTTDETFHAENDRACCSFAYLLFGLLCFDRFTSRAFLSTQDPVASTAIPSSGGGKKYDAPSLS